MTSAYLSEVAENAIKNLSKEELLQLLDDCGCSEIASLTLELDGGASCESLVLDTFSVEPSAQEGEMLISPSTTAQPSFKSAADYENLALAA